jgi:hypothetical protein
VLSKDAWDLFLAAAAVVGFLMGLFRIGKK